MVSERIKHIGISPTMKIAAKAITMKAEGVDLVDLSVGEPDFPTPEHIREAAKVAIDENRTRYTLNQGMVPLREAIARKLKEENNVEYTISEIMVSNGAKHSIFNVVQTLIGTGDEVIIPAPYWVSYPEMVGLAEGRPVILPAHEENGFKLTAAELKDAISANTKALILCNPSNPTGAVYTRSELESLAEVLESEDVFVIADEIYEKLVYDGATFTSCAAISEKMKQRTIVVNGVSKAYAMTGWRIGYAAGPESIISGSNKIQSHSTSNASTVSQYAAMAALTGPQFEISKMRAEFQRRRNYISQRLDMIEGVSCRKPDGAFYVFPNISAFVGKKYNGTYIRNSYGLAYYLLREAKVATIPGAAFGLENYLRISYTSSMETIREGMDRIALALSRLKTPAGEKVRRLSNYKTRITDFVPTDADISIDKRDAIVAEAESQLKFDHYFEWNANISGVIIQLRTNNRHLYDFWVENWFPAQLEADLEPHGIIYAVDNVPGREPYVFYNSDSKTAVLFNTDFYGALRRIAVGMVSDLGGNLFGLHAVRGMTGDLGGAGFILMGPKGTHKSELFYNLLQHNDVALVSNDIVFIRYGGGLASADSPERKLYWPAYSAEIYDRLSPLIERSKCENVITGREGCEYSVCPYRNDCMLDRGLPFCLFGSKSAYAMLDPYWIGGMRKHVRRTDLAHIFLLMNDALAGPFRELEADETMQILASGQVHGKGVSMTAAGTPFFNPHLMTAGDHHMEKQNSFFRKLIQSARVYLLNTGSGTPAEIENRIIEACR